MERTFNGRCRKVQECAKRELQDELGEKLNENWRKYSQPPYTDVSNEFTRTFGKEKDSL